MRKVLLALAALVFSYNGYAQCSSSFSVAMAPSGNNLLRASLTNSCTPTTPPTGKTVWATIYWGDGNTSGAGPTGTYTHNYAATGTYTVGVKVSVFDSITSTVYCIDSSAKSLTVAYAPCATSFTTVKSGLSVTVTAVNPAGTTGMTYSWNWGDGSPAGSGSPASHTYTTGGTKTITLTATNGTCSYNNAQSVPVTSTGCTGLTANFSYSGSTPTYTFINTSTNSSGKVRSSQWSFGDGNTATTFNAMHTYATGGSYSVMLINKWIDSSTGLTVCIDTAIKTVTVSTPPNVISGSIIQDSFNYVASPQYKVWLIVYDSATTSLSAVDSQTFTGSNYSFSGKAAGTYRTKAKLLNGPTSGTGALPTYHTSSLLWSGATLINHTGGSSINKHIWLQYGTVTSGPGFIAGNVSAGANKGTSSGIPDMTILLLDAAGNPVKYAVTDANGDYSFNNLAPAAYKVHPEDAGYTTTAASITILNNEPTFNGVNFTRSQSRKTIAPEATGITNVNALADFAIYPNPAKDKVNISWNNTNNDVVTIIVTDVTGKKIQQLTNNTGNAEVKMNDLQKGLYFITLEGNNTKTTQKLLLQ